MNNKLRCLMMAMVSTLFLFGFSNSNAQVIVSGAIPSNANPNSGDQITVAINFDMTGMAGTADSLLGSFTATIDWDPTVLSFVSHGGILQGFVGVVNTTQAGTGHITFNGANPLGVSGMFDVVVFTFDVSGAGGTSTALDLEYSAMAAAFTFNNLLPFLTVNDGMVTVAGGAINQPPQLTAIPNQTMDENAMLDVPVTATDPDTDNITLSVNNLPSFGSFTDNGDGTGTISFAPMTGDAGVYPNIEVVAADDGTPSLSDTVSFMLTVTQVGVNNPPQLTAISDQMMDENTTLDVPATATDPDTDNITLSVNNLPSFGSFTDNGDGTGTISFAPMTGDAGVYPNIEVVATDDGTPSLSDTVSFALTVNQAQPAQVVSSAIPSNANPNANDTITVAINIDMTGMTAPDTLLGSFSANLDWDPNILEYVGDSGILQGFTGFVNTAGADTGHIRFNGALPTGIGGTFDVLVVSFAVIGVPQQSTTLDLEYTAMAAALTFTDLLPYLNVADGFVTVAGAVVLSQAIPSNSIPNVNDTITVAINIDMTGMTAPDTLLGSFSANLDWDPNILEYVGDSGILQGFTGFVNTAGADTGHVRFNGAKPTGQNGAFDVVILTFAVIGFPGQSTTLDLEYTAMAAAFTFTDLIPYLNAVDGLVTIAGVANIPPVLDSIPNQTMDEGDTLNVPISSMDPDGNAITLTANNLPSFGSLIDNGNGTGTIRFTPNFGQAGVYQNIEVIATDNGGPPLSDTTYFDLTVNPVVGINDPFAQIPVKYELSQNFPNPFNPTTQIRFALPKASTVEIYLFNVMGQKVATILDEYEPAGYHTINFDASQMASGVYFFSIKAGEFKDIKKMILMK